MLTITAEMLADYSELFSQLDVVDLQELLDLSTRRQIKARKQVCRKGALGDELYIVLTGKLKVCISSGEGREAILGYLEEGEILGEMALIDGCERSADVVAVHDTELLVIHRLDFLPFLEARPRACMSMMKALSRRLRKTDAMVEDMRFLDLRSRLAKALHQLAQEHGRTVVGGGIRIDLKISQEELGGLVGATRENVNKYIRSWVEEGVLETAQSTIIIRRPEQLLAS